MARHRRRRRRSPGGREGGLTFIPERGGKALLRWGVRANRGSHFRLIEATDVAEVLQTNGRIQALLPRAPKRITLETADPIET